MSDAPFPDDFLFGVATSAYQTEGGIENDWAAWERAGKLKNPNERCGDGVEHWERFFDDVPLISALGAQAYRLSLEWARIEPEPGRFDEAALQGYRARLEALQRAGIKPVVTLLHFTHPAWFHDETPWHEASSLVAWERFVRRCVPLFDGLEVMVTTLNEPNVLMLGGYLSGLMPPGIADGKKTFAAMANLVRAHVIAWNIIKERNAATPVGIAQNLLAFGARRWWHPLDQALARLAEGAYDHAFLEALQTGVLEVSMPGLSVGRARIDGADNSTDFTGVNYYTRAHLRFVPRPPYLEMEYLDPSKRGLTDLGWEWFPEGFGQVLRQAQRYGKPIYVTENGLDDRSGARRSRFLYEHLQQLLYARANGVDVRGYFHWSLLDNFEWLEGWEPRFGLYRVDRSTMKREWTSACDYYRRLTATRRLTPPTDAEQKPANASGNGPHRSPDDALRRSGPGADLPHAAQAKRAD